MTSAARSFVMTMLVGVIVTVLVWIAVRSAAEPADEDTIVNRAVLLVGFVTTVAAAGWATITTGRRERNLRALAECIRTLGDTEFGGAIAVPSDHSPAMDVVFRRITDAQERIERRIARLESDRRRGFQVLGHMTDGVIAVTADRRVLLLNPAARRLLALRRESLLGRPLAEVVRVPQIIAAVDKVLRGEGPEEVVVDPTAAHERYLRVLAVDLPSEGAAGALVTIRDETQVRQLEKMRREFIANVSHELKTPLAAIKGYAETLQLGAKDDPRACHHFLEQIDVQSNRLERLINDMLQLARAQTGPEHLVLGPIPLVPVLDESVRTYEPIARAREISVRLDAAERTAAVVADREALLTIVNNLVGNAVRYTPTGGHVTVGCHRAGTNWAIVVADDGVGIPEADQQRVFERFYRVEKARDATRGGTGLGLSIVKNLVQSLGGEVRLRSRLGQGATFEVLVPAAAALTDDAQAGTRR